MLLSLDKELYFFVQWNVFGFCECFILFVLFICFLFVVFNPCLCKGVLFDLF